MQTTYSRIWTLVADSIPYDDNHYAMSVEHNMVKNRKTKNENQTNKPHPLKKGTNRHVMIWINSIQKEDNNNNNNNNNNRISARTDVKTRKE